MTDDLPLPVLGARVPLLRVRHQVLGDALHALGRRIVGRQQRVAARRLGAQLAVLLDGRLLQLRGGHQVAHQRGAPDLHAAVVVLGAAAPPPARWRRWPIPRTEAMIQRRMPSSPIDRRLRGTRCCCRRGPAMTFSLCRQRLSRRRTPRRGAMSSKPQHCVEVVPRIADIPAAAWDACANPDPAVLNPFISHGFLKALEDAGTRRRPLRLDAAPPRAQGRQAQAIVGCAPCYLKSHSQGEYVFDRSWADAYERAGGQLLPQAADRRAVHAGAGAPAAGAARARRRGQRGAAGARRRSSWSSATTCRGCTSRSPARASGSGSEPAASSSAPTSSSTGAMPATPPSTISWPRSPRASARRCARSARRRSRPASPSNGCAAATSREAHWDAFFAFYMDTGSRKWGRPYLNRKAFSLIGAATGEQLPADAGHARASKPIAGSLHMIGGDCLYGRYWGAVEHHPCLHFELCYYQAIEYAIQHKIRARGGRRPGRAQAGARLPADQDLLGALHRRSVAAPRDRRLSRARARLRGCGQRGARRIRAVPQGAPIRPDARPRARGGRRAPATVA